MSDERFTDAYLTLGGRTVTGWPGSAAENDAILVDDTDAVMTEATFLALADYSCLATPTGMTIGKRWRRGVPYLDPTKWWMGEYIPDAQPGWVTVRWRRIHVVKNAGGTD